MEMEARVEGLVEVREPGPGAVNMLIPEHRQVGLLWVREEMEDTIAVAEVVAVIGAAMAVDLRGVVIHMIRVRVALVISAL